MLAGIYGIRLHSPLADRSTLGGAVTTIATFWEKGG